MERTDTGEVVDNYGVSLVAWTDPRDPRDHMNVDMPQLSEHLRARGAGLPPLFFMGIEPHRWDSDPMDQPPLVGFKVEVMSENNDAPSSGFMGSEVMRFLYALWLFMGETYIDSRVILPDRPAVKRAIRAGRPTAEVRVIRLRKREQTHREDAEHLDDDDILWSHRWLVKGHWRNQWYPSEDRHRPKWISGYVKGPEHLPLLVKDTVFSVDR